MQSAVEVKQAIEAGSAKPDLHTRAHTLGAPRSALGRFGLRLQTALENFVARVSVLPDTAVYNTTDFPWVRNLEANWRSIRAELDRVLVHREQMPSFH